MKQFFPFLTILLILCVLLYANPAVSAFAQQHDSFASAKSLSLDHSVSISLPANATEYYYFTSLPSTAYTGQKYQITLSKTDSLSISAYNDQGNSIDLNLTAANTSYWTGYIDNASNGSRFFLALHNHAKRDISVNLSVKLLHSVTAAPESDNGAHTTAAAKPGKSTQKPAAAKPGKSTQKSAAAKPGKSTQKSAAAKPGKNTQKSATAKPGKSTQKSATAKPSKSTQKSAAAKPSKSTQKPATVIPRNNSQKSAAAKPGKSTQKPATVIPRNDAQEPTATKSDNHSRSNPILSTHFFRMPVGYSISAYELLIPDSSDSEITFESLTPENLSIQNNIIFAKTPGLAIIKICLGNDTTTCTIYIQELQ